MTNVAENRQALFVEVEVEDLREKSRKHFDELNKAKNKRRITELKLNDAMRVIKTD